MSEQNAVALLIVSASRDPVEAINSALRRAGEPVHCTWLPTPRDLPELLTQVSPQLLIHVGRAHDRLQTVVDIRDRVAAGVPLIVVTDSPVDEARIADLMALGAHDAVSLANPQRLTAVMLRELAAYRVARTLEAAIESTDAARGQLETLLEHSNDAVAQVQEGILVEANRAWLELLGVNESSVGEPVMDLFDEPAKPTVRAALSACLQGRFNERTVKARTRRGDGGTVDLEIVLVPGVHDGEPCVRLVVPARWAPGKKSVRADEATGLLHRRELLQALTDRLAQRAAGGIRCIALITVNDFDGIEQEVGLAGGEEVVADIGMRLKAYTHPKEIMGRLADAQILVLLERGNQRDVDGWTRQIGPRVGEHSMQVAGRALTVSCSIGLAPLGSTDTLDEAIAKVRERPGQPKSPTRAQTPTPQRAAARASPDDRVWVKEITEALLKNRFRLVQQPIASLQGEDADMFDVLLRMIDGQGREILPSEFMPAAERNDLSRKIDRWVIGASIAFAAHRQPGCLLVRLARESVLDETFLPWLDNALSAGHAQPQRLCFQVTEQTAVSHLHDVQALAAALRERGFRFALEAFGSRHESVELLEQVPLDFVKIDGSLIQSLAGDGELQGHVKMLIDTAAQRMIQAIGERVEDADTVTILWQAGMQYIQGYFVNEPTHAKRAEADRPSAGR